jgi:uncharacterized protein YndB with AHSA1/START domain
MQLAGLRPVGAGPRRSNLEVPVTTTDRIEKQIILRASRARVWRALTDPAEFETWFRVRLANDFVVGQKTTGAITAAGYENVRFEATVERLEAERHFAFRWHPGAIDPKVDYSREPTTLVAFDLLDHPDGVLLKVVESGFDRLPAHRRNEAFLGNSQGWEIQLRNIRAHVTAADAPIDTPVES